MRGVVTRSVTITALDAWRRAVDLRSRISLVTLRSVLELWRCR
jgi:hypothetical protein